MDKGEPVSVWAVLKRWVGPIPRWPYLLVAMFFVGVGKLIEYYELLKPVERFAETALRQVSAFSPLSLAYGFLGHMESCRDVTDAYSADVETKCRQLTFAAPQNVISGLYRTVLDVLETPNVAAMLILLAALLVGFLLAWRVTSLLTNNAPGLPIGILIAAIAAPFVGSAIALVLQIAGIVFFTIAGTVVGFVIWIGAQLALFLAVLKTGRAVQENAALLKQVDDRLRPPPP